MHDFLSGLFGHQFLITDYMPRVQPQWVLESGLFPCLQVSFDINFGMYAGFFWISISHNRLHAARATAVGVSIMSLSMYAGLFWLYFGMFAGLFWRDSCIPEYDSHVLSRWVLGWGLLPCMQVSFDIISFSFDNIWVYFGTFKSHLTSFRSLLTSLQTHLTSFTSILTSLRSHSMHAGLF